MTSRLMKESGIEWIGKIPKNWKVAKLGKIGKFSASGIDKKINPDEEPVKIINYVDVYRNRTMMIDSSINFMEVTTSSKKRNEHLVNKGDIIFTPSSETIDEIGRSCVIYENIDNLSYSYHVLRYQTNHEIDLSFRKYMTNNHFLYSYFSSKAVGTVRKTLNRQDFKSAPVLIPPIEEQQKIAAFLNDKVSKIDSILSDTKESIEALKQYKQSLITETVTKGLNSDVPMKDSGIEWVNEIPEHWEVHRVGQMFQQVKKKNLDLLETNLLSLSYGNIVKRNINTTEGLLPDSFEGYNRIEPGDIVLRMTDLQNDQKSLRVGLSTQKGIITSAYITIRKTSDIFSPYAYYFLHSFDIYKGFYGMGAGVRQGVNFNELKKIDLVYPPIEEQKQIATYLDEKTKHIDSLIQEKQQLINELETYKKSLIYEYVTGKKHYGDKSRK